MKKCKQDNFEKNISEVIEFSISYSNVNGEISTDMIARNISKEDINLCKYKCLDFLERIGENKNKYIDIIEKYTPLE